MLTKFKSMQKLIARAFLASFICFFSLSALAQDKVLLCTGKSSHSYHKKTCTGLKQCRATIVSVNIKDAIEIGKDPCDFCYGHNAGSPNPGTKMPIKLSERSANSNSASSQCLATTKKGSRCSRLASSDGYCWQHD